MFGFAAKSGAAALLISCWALACCSFRAGLQAEEQPKFRSSEGDWADPFRDGKDKPVVIIFVRTDCPISNRYATELSRLHTKFAAQTVWWLVYPDSDVTIQAIRQHTKEYKLPIPALVDPNHELVKLAGARVTPEAAVFLPRKKLVYRGRIDDRFVAFGNYRPEATRRDLEEALMDVLSGKPVRIAEMKAVGCAITSEP